MFRCVDFLQVRTPQGSVISDNCGTDKSNLDGVVIPFGEDEMGTTIFQMWPKRTKLPQRQYFLWQPVSPKPR